MAANEDAERRAMQGELTELETAWREAEEIAAIADNLLKVRAALPGVAGLISVRALVRSGGARFVWSRPVAAQGESGGPNQTLPAMMM
jgi:hypothetical protein